MLGMEHPDLLLAVRSELESHVGELHQIAKSSGISYDTLLRIKNSEGDPGHSKVQTLARHLGIRYTIKVPRKPADQPAKEG